MQGTLSNFISIFKDHVVADTELQYFAYGEIFEINARLMSDKMNFKTPLLWLDEPMVVPDRNRQNLYTNTFHSAYWIVVKLPNAPSFDDIENAYTDAHTKAERVVAMLYKLQRGAGIRDFKIGKEEAISRKLVQSGNLVGWRTEFQIQLETTLIHHVD